LLQTAKNIQALIDAVPRCSSNYSIALGDSEKLRASDEKRYLSSSIMSRKLLFMHCLDQSRVECGMVNLIVLSLSTID